MPVRPGATDDASPDPDQALVLRAGQGDRAACAALVDRYLARIVSLAGRTLMNRADAEEVAQDVFLRVWQSAPRWRPGAARFSTWLYRVTLNLCTDRLRLRRPAGSDELPDIADDAPSAASGLQRKDVSLAVGTAMRALPDRQREAIVLCYYQELDDSEAAQVLEISVDALESLLSRGRRKLRELLRQQAPDLIGEMS